MPRTANTTSTQTEHKAAQCTMRLHVAAIDPFPTQNAALRFAPLLESSMVATFTDQVRI